MGNPILDMIQPTQTVQQQNNALPTSMDDPRMDSVKQYVQSHGGNAKAAFYQLCKEKMMNPATLINQFFGR